MASSALSSLKSSAFRDFWLAQLVSNIGTWMQRVAVGWLIYQREQSGAVLAIVMAVGSSTDALLAPLGGLAADRFDRRKLLMGTQTIQLGCAATLAGLAAVDRAETWIIAGLLLISGAAGGLGLPASQTLIGETAGPQRVASASAMTVLQFNLARVIGPMFAVAALPSLGESGCFALNSISFVPMILVLARQARLQPARHTAANSSKPTRQLIEASRFVAMDKVLSGAIILTAAMSMFGLPLIGLAPLFAATHLHVGAVGLGGMLTAIGVGAILALVPAGGLNTEDGPRTIRWTSALVVVLFVALAMCRVYWVAIVLLGIIGGALGVHHATTRAMFHERAPDALRGRCMSLYIFAYVAPIPIGQLIMGFTADIWNTMGALLLSALAIFVAALSVRSRLAESMRT